MKKLNKLKDEKAFTINIAKSIDKIIKIMLVKKFFTLYFK